MNIANVDRKDFGGETLMLMQELHNRLLVNPSNLSMDQARNQSGNSLKLRILSTASCMNKILLLLILASISLFSTAQKSAKRELRGAWVTTYFNLDWPLAQNHSEKMQKDALIAILDQHKATGMNAIYFQVRGQCDALYESSIEPWSYILTGTQGKSPGYDPLQFAIEETHKRGMELHAWINPYRAIANTDNLPRFVNSHVVKQHPEWLLAQGKERILNPGLPEVRAYLNDVITDIVKRYDIDGIHFDDYFYMIPSASPRFNDDATYAADPRNFPATTAGRDNWRRDNVNILIRDLYETITSLKPWVKFGISPTGIYRSSTDPSIGSPTSSFALQHYSAAYADTKFWLQQQWVDYIAPQLYWFINQGGSDYKLLVPWWNNQANGRHIYIGQAIYKVNDPAQGVNWANRSQIPNQMRMNREAQFPNVLGEIGFRTLHLRNNPLNVRDSMRTRIYQKPALLPAMLWKDATAPEAPGNVVVQKQGSSHVVTWEKREIAGTEFGKVKQFVIYRGETAAIDIADTTHLLAITNTDITTFTDVPPDGSKMYYYAVTSLNRLHAESAPSITDLLPPVITCPGLQTVSVDNNCAFAMPDYRLMATATDDVSAPAQILITQIPAAGTLVAGKGNHSVTLTATDASGKSSSCSFAVDALDSLAPEISNISVDPAALFPANHKMRDVTVSYEVRDNCGTVGTVLSVTSNEPDNGKGDGNKEKDWVVVDNHHVKLRAERSGSGDGRIYTITITATDATGNRATQSIDVVVPHDHSDITQRKTTGVREVVQKGLLVTVQQNPSANRFVIRTQSPAAGSLLVRVLDASGRVVESRTGVAPNSTFQLGTTYRSGVYYLQVAQGTEVQTARLVKTRD